MSNRNRQLVSAQRRHLESYKSTIKQKEVTLQERSDDTDNGKNSDTVVKLQEGEIKRRMVTKNENSRLEREVISKYTRRHSEHRKHPNKHAACGRTDHTYVRTNDEK